MAGTFLSKALDSQHSSSSVARDSNCMVRREPIARENTGATAACLCALVSCVTSLLCLMRDILAPGCDATGVLDIPYGEGRAMLKGRVYR